MQACRALRGRLSERRVCQLSCDVVGIAQTRHSWTWDAERCNVVRSVNSHVGHEPLFGSRDTFGTSSTTCHRSQRLSACPLRIIVDATELAAEDDREQLQRRGLRRSIQNYSSDLFDPALRPRALPLAQSRMCRLTTDRAAETSSLAWRLRSMQSIMPVGQHIHAAC